MVFHSKYLLSLGFSLWFANAKWTVKDGPPGSCTQRRISKTYLKDGPPGSCTGSVYNSCNFNRETNIQPSQLHPTNCLIKLGFIQETKGLIQEAPCNNKSFNQKLHGHKTKCKYIIQADCSWSGGLQPPPCSSGQGPLFRRFYLVFHYKNKFSLGFVNCFVILGVS